MRRIRKNLLRYAYVFTLANGETFSGVLEDADDEFFVLQRVCTFTQDQWLPVDGRLILERSRVMYLQREA
jgi:hypothetical protein